MDNIPYGYNNEGEPQTSYREEKLLEETLKSIK